MRGSKLVVPIKAVAFAIRGNITEDVKMERLKLFLEQEAERKGIRIDFDAPLLQGQVDGKDEFFFYNGPKGRPLVIPKIPETS